MTNVAFIFFIQLFMFSNDSIRKNKYVLLHAIAVLYLIFLHDECSMN